MELDASFYNIFIFFPWRGSSHNEKFLIYLLIQRISRTLLSYPVLDTLNLALVDFHFFPKPISILKAHRCNQVEKRTELSLKVLQCVIRGVQEKFLLIEAALAKLMLAVIISNCTKMKRP